MTTNNGVSVIKRKFSEYIRHYIRLRKMVCQSTHRCSVWNNVNPNRFIDCLFVSTTYVINLLTLNIRLCQFAFLIFYNTRLTLYNLMTRGQKIFFKCVFLPKSFTVRFLMSNSIPIRMNPLSGGPVMMINKYTFITDKLPAILSEAYGEVNIIATWKRIINP